MSLPRNPNLLIGGIYPKVISFNVNNYFNQLLILYQYSFVRNGCYAHFIKLTQILKPSIQKYACSSITCHINLTTYNNNIKNKDQKYSHVLTKVSHESGI